MRLSFSGQIWYWRGPSPFHFVTVPEVESAELRAISSFVSYGWGVVPVVAQSGRTNWTTSLFSKDGGYLVPVRSSVRVTEGLDVGDTITVVLTVGESGLLRD